MLSLTIQVVQVVEQLTIMGIQDMLVQEILGIAQRLLLTDQQQQLARFNIWTFKHFR